jgi:hypothetical protein
MNIIILKDIIQNNVNNIIKTSKNIVINEIMSDTENVIFDTDL